MHVTDLGYLIAPSPPVSMKTTGPAPEVSLPIDFVGFEAPDAFVVGYGLDAAQIQRNLPYTGVVD
jgi:hypoxanthine phosphoribosyltransferase